MANSIPIVDLLPEFEVEGIDGINASLVGDGTCDNPWLLRVSLKIDSSDPGNILAQTSAGASAVIPDLLNNLANFELVNGNIVYTYGDGTAVTVTGCDLIDGFADSSQYPPPGSKLVTKNADGTCVNYTMFPAGALLETGRGDVYNDLSGNGNGQMGLKDYNSGGSSTSYSIPFDASDNNWIIGAAPMSQGPACLKNSGVKVYYDPSDGEFLVEPPPLHTFEIYKNDDPIYLSGFYGAVLGDVYRPTVVGISNSDDCERDYQLKVTYEWLGYEASIINNNRYRFEYQIKNSLNSWVPISSTGNGFYGGNGSTAVQFKGGALSYTELRSLDYGSMVELGMRFVLVELVGSGTLGYSNSDYIYPSQIVVETISKP